MAHAIFRIMVRFENVGMRYGSGPEVLRDVTFELEGGSFTFLTGLSGAGKTTLLKLIYLAEPPSRGLITLFGQELATAKRQDLPPLRRRMLVGLALLVLGAGAAVLGFLGSGGTGLLVLGLGALGVLVAVALMSPLLGRPIIIGLGWIYARLFGQVHHLQLPVRK